MQWFNEPGTYDVPVGAGPDDEGYGGRWSIVGEEGSELILRPDAKKDFWRKTYYKPMFIKNDGPCLFKEVKADIELTMEVYF